SDDNYKATTAQGHFPGPGISRGCVKFVGIPQGLNAFVDEVGERLSGYRYKKPARRQKNLTRDELHSQVIDAFFLVRVLNRVTATGEIPVSQLSSGEKRKALIDVAYSFLSASSPLRKEVILAVDEPEASLHTAACFDQFEKLIGITDSGNQVITTTHWYGFIPIVSHGVANLTDRDANDIITITPVDLKQYRESVKKKVADSKGKFPTDVSLKSVNDLVQSIMFSIRKDEPYNWLICEGSSEKIYF
ncbi:AAA family ATPase, partial [Thiohalomonas denitrificans]